jgi:hypothetical protein
MLAPLDDPKVGAAGCVLPCEFNRVAACPADIIEPQIHVQSSRVGSCRPSRSESEDSEHSTDKSI